MKEFPQVLSAKNKDSFSHLNYQRLLCYLRRDLYEHIISHNETQYFSLDEFNKRVGDMKKTQKMVTELIPELENLGWHCKISFGDTGLFIYSSEEPPVNCWEGESLS